MVLAAGLGTRLRPVTNDMPKPMVPVLGRPVMEHIVRLLGAQGFGEIVANVHWFPQRIREHFGDGTRFGVSLSYSEEEALLGTAGGVRAVAGFLGEDFLIISGDALTDLDLGPMREFHASHDGIATLATRHVDDTSGFGVVISGADGRIQGFQEKPDPAEALTDQANCGIYMFRSEIFDYFPTPAAKSLAAGPDDPPEFTDWALDVFPALLEADVPFYAHPVEAYWNDIGNLGELWQGNVDGLEGVVELEAGADEVSPGVRVREGTSLGDADVAGPALIGSDVRIGEGIEVQGPAVLGDGSVVGDGARVEGSLLLAGAEIEAGARVTGSIVLADGEILATK